jgi:putative hemolysin
MAESGDKGAAAALRLLDDPTQFLSTVQVGITSIGVLNGIVGEAAFSDGVAHWLQGFGMAEKAAGIGATALVVTIITFTTIIFGELVPKRIGQLYPEPVARWVSRPMRGLATAAKPFVRLLSVSTHGVLRLLRIDTTGTRAVTEEEITASLEEGVDAGLIEEHEHQMVRNVFHLDDRPLTSLMVPRTDIDWLDADASVAQCLRQAGGNGEQPGHSWYPVCRGGLDDVVGVISVARLLQLGPEQAGPVGDHTTPATFVPETLTGMALLEQLRERSGRMVFVVDEYGVVQGLLTPRDLLEAITGELQPGAQIDAWATPRGDGSWLLDGLMPVNELKARLDIQELPDEEKGRYNTTAGLLLSVSGHLPTTGERISCAGWIFEVVDLDGKRIDKVLATADPDNPVPG